jgi:hypothetical protein
MYWRSLRSAEHRQLPEVGDVAVRTDDGRLVECFVATWFLSYSVPVPAGMSESKAAVLYLRARRRWMEGRIRSQC